MEIFNGMCTEDSAKISDRYFEVNNYGYSRRLERDYVTSRPLGRPDYHLIYVKAGTVVLYREERTIAAPTGHLILYRPGEKQFYRYVSGSDTEYDWFHFTGGECETMLGDLFDEGSVISVGNAYEIDEAMVDMRTHVSGSDPLSREYAAGRMMVMLTSLKQRRGKSHDRAMEKVLMQLRREKFGEGSNGAYAALANMSESHFLRRFAAYTNSTPHKYKTRHLLHQARELLRDTEMNVSEVAYALGFNDSLYFSRLFKKEYGVSPMKLKQM